MNRIPHEVFEQADDMFCEGASIREVVRRLKISKGTANNIQKFGKIADIAHEGKTRVNTGKRKDGTMSFYFTSEIREHWNRQQYGRIGNF